jgi:uncharacterized protein (TIGR02246 family)
MSDDEKAIRAFVDKWMAASKARDTETVMKMMSDDVVFMTVGQKPFGKKEFAATSHGMKDIRVEGTSDIQEIQVLGDWAWMRNHLRITITPPNGAPMVKTGYTLTILKKDSNGNWQIARDANLLT